MKSLVTGGAGFIGSHVVDALIKLGHDVTVLDDLSGGFEDNVSKKAKFINGSVTDYELVKQIFKEHAFDYVYHIAAYAAEGLSHFIRRFNYQTNLIGSVNLINESIKHNIKCFVFTSSIAAYGEGQLPFTEDTTPQPEDPYGISKYSVELDLKSAHQMFGLNYIIFRPHNVYGERQNTGDKYRNVIGIFMNQVVNNKPLTIFGDGSQTRAFTYIGDVAPHIARAPMVKEAINQVFNIGADHVYTVNELAEVVSEAFGKKAKIKYLPGRNEVKHVYSDHSKFIKAFGKQDQTSLKVGIQKNADWVKECGIRSSKEFNNIEVDKNMPNSWKK